MNTAIAIVSLLLLGSAAYAAGRLQARAGYRIGHRFGYRQGYFDGERAGWNRRRREAQAAVRTALTQRCGDPVTAVLPTQPLARVSRDEVPRR